MIVIRIVTPLVLSSFVLLSPLYKHIASVVSSSCLTSVMRSATLTTTKFPSNATCRPCTAAALASLFIATFFVFNHSISLDCRFVQKKGEPSGKRQKEMRVIKIGRFSGSGPTKRASMSNKVQKAYD